IKYPVRTGIGSRHALRIEGGEETFRYAGAISYNNVAGAMKGSERNTFNGNMHFIYNLKNLIFQNDLQIVSSKSKNSPYGNFADYTLINSYYKPYDDNGNLVKYLEDHTYYPTDRQSLPLSYINQTMFNPLYDALQPSKDESEYQQIINNFSIEWYILPEELFVRGRFNVISERSRKDTYISAKHSMFDKYSAADFERKGKYTYGTENKSTYEADITLNYSKKFNSVHQVYAGLGYNIAESKYEDYTTVGEGITVINMDFLGMASKYEKEGRPGGVEGITCRVGFIFNGNYTYNRRYFVDFSGSVEGSSQSGAGNRYAPFWSAGIGWNMNNEPFIKNIKMIQEGRLRFSYGSTGSQSFSPYQALLTYKDSGGKNYMGWYGTSIMGMGNKDLGWQKTRQYNIGTDWRLWDGRIRLNLDVYNRITDNLLADVNLPSSSGFTSYRAMWERW
ncbi:MAG: SusC/RagA family TonB-linked outer membrane protein, partial [Bacteroides intestinalis]|nr:SusC/RagA family TonB-linked outer membrane protein [Bacteroides intestinalis]